MVMVVLAGRTLRSGSRGFVVLFAHTVVLSEARRSRVDFSRCRVDFSLVVARLRVCKPFR